MDGCARTARATQQWSMPQNSAAAAAHTDLGLNGATGQHTTKAPRGRWNRKDGETESVVAQDIWDVETRHES